MIRPPPRSPLFPSTTLFRSYDTGFSDGLSTPIGAPDFPLPDWGKLDWALSQTNLNNSFTASVIYDLPFGKGKKYGSGGENPNNSLLGNWRCNPIEKITLRVPPLLLPDNPSSDGALINN